MIWRTWATVCHVKPSRSLSVMKTSFSFPLRNAAVCSLLAAMAATGAQAASGTWTQLAGGSATGTWSDALTGNWAGGIVADGSGFTADFGTLDITATSTITLGAPRTIGNLIFADTGTATAGSWNLVGTGANTLTLAGTTPTITVNALNNNSLVTISASIGGTDGLTKAGTGLLALSGSNNYTGGTSINAGSLRAANNFAFGTGAVTVANNARLQLNAVSLANSITLNGSSALLANTGTSTLSGLVTLGSASTVSFTANNNVAAIFSGTLDLAGNVLTINPGGNTGMFATISGSIVGSGGISKTGVGLLTISGDNSATFSGSTSHTLGTLAVGSDNALGSGVLALVPGNNNTVTIRSADTSARTISNVVTIGQGINSIYRFGSAVTGNLRFSNTTAITLAGGQKLFEVYNRTQFDAGFTGGNGITMQVGTGTLVLSGSNTYTGTTTVNAGTLLVDGSLASGSTVTVATGATLGGAGVINGNTTVSGILAPGASTESLAFGGNLTLAGTTNTIFEINGTNRGSLVNGYDAIDLTNASGLLTYDGTLTLTMTGLIANGTYDLFSFTTAAAGSFDAINFAGGAYTGTFIQSGSLWTATSAQGQVFTFDQTTGDLTVVPEPTTSVLLGTGLMTVLFLRRRQRRN